LTNCAGANPETLKALRATAVEICSRPEAEGAMEDGDLRSFPFEERERGRIYQFDRSRGVSGFPEKPEDVLKG